MHFAEAHKKLWESQVTTVEAEYHVNYLSETEEALANLAQAMTDDKATVKQLSKTNTTLVKQLTATTDKLLKTDADIQSLRLQLAQLGKRSYCRNPSRRTTITAGLIGTLSHKTTQVKHVSIQRKSTSEKQRVQTQWKNLKQERQEWSSNEIDKVIGNMSLIP